MFHVLHGFFDGDLVIYTTRLEEVELLCAAKNGVDVGDASAKVLNTLLQELNKMIALACTSKGVASPDQNYMTYELLNPKPFPGRRPP